MKKDGSAPPPTQPWGWLDPTHPAQKMYGPREASLAWVWSFRAGPLSQLLTPVPLSCILHTVKAKGNEPSQGFSDLKLPRETAGRCTRGSQDMRDGRWTTASPPPLAQEKHTEAKAASPGLEELMCRF